MIAPQFGLWGGLPPRTDNPAAQRPVPPPLAIRRHLAALRAEFAARAARK